MSKLKIMSGVRLTLFQWFIITSIVIGKSQSPDTKFVNPDNIWQVSSPGWITKASNWQISFSKDDTLIQGKYYYEEMIDNEENPGWKGTKKFYREEDGKVYVLNNNSELLEYDFNLLPGDSIIGLYLEKKYVRTLDYIITKDGLERKKLTLDLYCNGKFQNSVIWIEGIGEIKRRIASSCLIVDPEPSLDCFLQNDIIVFSNFGCLDPNRYKKMINFQYIWQVDVTKPALPGVTERLYRFGNGKKIDSEIYYELLQSEGFTKTSVVWFGTGKYFREADGVVYYYRNGVDVPYFDFNLKDGDEFDLFYGSVTHMSIKKSDTVYLADNKVRRRILLQCNPYVDESVATWIEGIGDISSFLYTYAPCTIDDPAEVLKLRCVLLASNYKEIFLGTGVQGCFKANANDVESKGTPFGRVYPNPAVDQVIFQSEYPLLGKVCLYDLSGKLCLTEYFDQGNLKVELNVSKLKPGIYIYKWYGSNNQHMFGKIILH
jgi:hypothetical protein